ncbi:MAG: enoyl-CoA hydratase/isomerase family protein [Woeseiaceae bacterium]|nr:enoyl-CoA hydratase/isomerase family protein [Woeseiaceae bacterium]
MIFEGNNLEDNDLNLEIRDGVANITLNRAKQRNAFTSTMIEALDTALNKIDADKDCRVIVLRGKGGHFCSGWDFHDIHAMCSRGGDALQQQFKTNLEVLNKLENHSRVTISLVEGAVMGFGFSLVARSDIVLAPESCVTALPEIALGIVPAIVMVDAQRVLPQKIALEWLLSGRTIASQEALQAGFFTRVIADADFEDAARVSVRQIAEYSPATLARTKELFRQLIPLSSEQAEQVAIDTAIDALNSAAAEEGIAAMNEKRSPEWPE